MRRVECLKASPDFGFRETERRNALWFEATRIAPLPGAAILGLLGLGSSGWLIRRKRRNVSENS